MARVTTVALDDDSTHQIPNAVIEAGELADFIEFCGDDGRTLVMHRTRIRWYSTQEIIEVAAPYVPYMRSSD